MVISSTVFEIQTQFCDSQRRLVKAVERFSERPSEIHSYVVGKTEFAFFEKRTVVGCVQYCGENEKNIQNHATSTSQNLVKHIVFMFEIDSGHALRSYERISNIILIFLRKMS